MMAGNAGTRLVAKTLGSVEIDRQASNQHEFHAGRLRIALGYEKRTAGRLVIVLHDESSEPIVTETKYTIYDAREGTRRTEWRLYYRSHLIAEHARAGDLLVLLRPDVHSTDLYAVITRQGSLREEHVKSALALRDYEKLKEFTAVVPGRPSMEVAAELSEVMLTPDIPIPASEISEHPLVARALAENRMPSTSEMTRAAQELVQRLPGPGKGPDDYLWATLLVETALFEQIESALGKRGLDALVAEGSDFKSFLEFALSKLQARKARRGISLQNHVRTLLELYEVPFSAQCETEPGERPDFIVPGCRQYHDRAFPDTSLRMVGCKSKIRDRWRQYLNEAARIPIKHHISVDPDLSSDLIRNMHANQLRTCVPEPIIQKHYSSNGAAELLLSIEDLITELRSVTTGLS